MSGDDSRGEGAAEMHSGHGGSAADRRARGRSGPLSHLRVLDISTMIAAPLSASLLADYGADVVKVERPGPGDPVRRFGAQKEGEGLYWKTLSRNKRSVALDLHHEEARNLLRRWIPRFDVLIENFRPGTLERWGLDPAVLRRAAPHLVVLRVTAYGQYGPYRDRPGFGTLAEAMTGLVAPSGITGSRPELPAFPLADVMAGHLGATAVLAAVERRRETGEGDCIDLAIYEAALKLVELDVVEADQLGPRPPETVGRTAAAPRGAYECADGQWIALAASTDSVAERVLRTVGGDDLVRDPRFATNADRLAHVGALDEHIAAWCRTRDRETAIREFSRTQCAVGPLETTATMLGNPQVLARDSVVRVDDPALGPVAMAGVFPRFATAGGSVRRTGPAQVGQDTTAVLAEDLGLSADALAELAMVGATAALPRHEPDRPIDTDYVPEEQVTDGGAEPSAARSRFRNGDRRL